MSLNKDFPLHAIVDTTRRLSAPPANRIMLAGVALLLCLAALGPAAEAQSQEVTIPGTGQRVPVCKPADLDSNVGFFPAKTNFTVAFNMRNVSESPCVPRPVTGYPMFDTAQSTQAKPFGLCMDCEDRLPDGSYLVRPPVFLNPGEMARQTFRWDTVPPTGAVKCLKLHALFGPVLVVTPRLFKPVCSEIAVSRVYPATFVPPVPEEQVPTDEAQARERFVLSSNKPRYYQGDMFALHVGLANPGSDPPSGRQCPTLFLREGSPDGSTRFDEVQPSGFKTCKSFGLGSNRNADWQSGFEVDSGAGSRWTGIGRHTFELFEPVGPSRDGQLRFVRSNKLTVQIDDPALIARKWAGKAKGVGVDVTLDKHTYELGEDVPLHIAIENFDAPVPIYATSPVWDPNTAIGIEVRNARGRLLPENERYSNGIVWIGQGHGLGPKLFPPGKLVPIERSLASQHWLPKRPGGYTVVVTWRPLNRTHLEPVSGLPRKGDFKIYATVQASATFRIVGEPPPVSHSEP